MRSSVGSGGLGLSITSLCIKASTPAIYDARRIAANIAKLPKPLGKV
jgi:hypothetical protein